MRQDNNRPIPRRPATTLDESYREQTDALLRDLGADEIVIETISCRVDDDDVQSVVSRLHAFAEANPRVVLGALSALIAGGSVAAGAAVLRKKRATSRSKATKKATSTKKATAKSKAPRTASKTARASSKRTLIEPHPGDKRYVRRDSKGRIKESVDVGRSLAADRRRKSKTRSTSGAGDKGDR